MLYRWIRPLLFLFSTEFIHNRTLAFLKIPVFRFFLSKKYRHPHSSLRTTLCGMDFENPVGLAAGFDKSGSLMDRISCLGFGFTEVGTVTPLPQEGNPKPRLFRLRRQCALVNRMGFNNVGMREMKLRFERETLRKIPIGINIGKNRDTSLQEAIQDYLLVIRELYQFGDYFAINVSSPNTPNLRSLQKKEHLVKLLEGLVKENKRIANERGLPMRPLFVKVSPDLSEGELDDIVEVAVKVEIHGMIASNSTTNHSFPEEGGLSGVPLRERVTEMIRTLYRKTEGKIAIIGVGGIASGVDAYEKIQLAKIYTLLGDSDAAIDQLEYVLSVPNRWSIERIKLEPWWDPLRHHPLFQKLIKPKV